ncbi:MAG: PilZ domain-containing protein [Candidatus Omnitrophica bacterium]|nr:PilZ domain-containing protein [Candidatus Omnitrophota bacterium]
MIKRRRYIRISTVLPIEFYLLDSNNRKITPWLEGFSRDISKNGICLVINDLWEGFWDRFSIENCKIFLQINLPFFKKPINLLAKIIWKDKKRTTNFFQYFLGLEFLEKKKENRTLFLYAVFKKILPYTTFVIMGILFINSLYFYNKFKIKYSLKEHLKAASKVTTITEEKKPITTKDIISQVYGWIKERQDLKSGLVLSYEGDQNLKETCFTYDQALATIVFVILEDLDRAKKILDFYFDKLKNSPYIYNAYYKNGEVAEYIAHTGPSTWIGLATLNYFKKTKDNKYLFIAEKITDFLLSLMDEQGGLKGGVTEDWYSTEQNLDAFAFFDLFYQLTGNAKYLDLANKIKRWIINFCYTSYGPPIRRGKGDSTIATDTFTMSLLCFGPKILANLNMDPEAILDFAVNNCEVEVNFADKKVKGFDFAKIRHMPRGGIISCEWTAQMILSFEVLADYYLKMDPIKHKKYFQIASFYFSELKKLIINSPSKVGKINFCLPYASTSFADTGHGWYTPKADKYCSLAANAYFLFSYFGYNPLKAEFLEISLKDYEDQQSNKTITELN